MNETFFLLCVSADPIKDSVLVEIVLILEGLSIAFFQSLDESERRSIMIVPLLGNHFEQMIFQLLNCTERLNF